MISTSITCFLTGAPTHELGALKQWLEAQGVLVTVPFNTFPAQGEPLSQALTKVIRACNLVVCVLDDNGPPAVVFEIGIALSLGKTVVTIADPKALPSFLSQDVVHIRASLGDEDVVRFQLSVLLRNFEQASDTSMSRQATVDRPQWNRADLVDRLNYLYSRQGDERARLSEEFVAMLLGAARCKYDAHPIVRSGDGRPSLRPDFSVWLDELRGRTNGPLIIEVKAFNRRDVINFGLDKLGKYLTVTGSEVGILVYVGPEKVEDPSHPWPFPILVMEILEFADAILTGTLARRVWEERSRISHMGRTRE